MTDGTYIYVLGGRATEGGGGSRTLWRYDPAADRYDTLASSTTPTVAQAAVYLDGVIYRIAGLVGFMEFTDTVEAYTVSSNSWAAAAPYPKQVLQAAAVALNGFIYAGGGGGPGDFSDKTYRYDPADDSWDDGPIADLLAARPNATGALYNGTWIVFVTGAVVGWDPLTNIWRSVDQIPRRPLDNLGATVAATDDALYVLGTVPSTSVSSLQRYVEISCASPTPTATPPGAATPTATSPMPLACLGDCGGDRAVSVADLVKGVSIALELQALGVCPAFDGNDDGNVTVNELVAAVGNALSGCP